MAHTEFGFQVIRKFLADLAPYGHPDFDPKLIGRGNNVMVIPLPRAKRAKNPHAVEGGQTPGPANNHLPPPETSSEQKSVGFTNNPFAKVEVK
jgi:hypothetical protein